MRSARRGWVSSGNQKAPRDIVIVHVGVVLRW
jgi:hypothetical protein